MSRRDAAIFVCRPRETGICTEGSCRATTVASCQFELRGRKVGQVCGRELCGAHVGKGAPLCGPHRRISGS